MKRFSSFLMATLFVATLFVTSCSEDKKEATPANATTYTAGTDAATAKASLVVKDKGLGTGTVTWTKDKVYVLDGLVFVNEGQTLTIQAGTVIKGKPGTAENASALVVARGGKIIAEGTATEPIIFTYEADNLGTPTEAKEQWGGLIILGRAGLNSNPGESAIEGIPTTEKRGLYGAGTTGSTTNDTESSGTLKYVSVRHGGTNIGAGNEINGITLGGVGSGTVIDFVEVFSNGDDGIEWFGGTVGIKHAVVAYCDDDMFDYDEGYRGTNQYLFGFQSATRGDRGGEHDGGTSPEDGQPYATPKFWNATYIGGGAAAGKRAVTIRDNAGGFYYNSVFGFFSRGVDIEILNTGQSSKSRWDAQQLSIENCTFVSINDKTGDIPRVLAAVTVGSTESNASNAATAANITAFQTILTSQFATLGNDEVTTFVTRTNPVPTTAGGIRKAGPPEAADYRGAFAPGQTAWYTTSNWTITSKYGLK